MHLVFADYLYSVSSLMIFINQDTTNTQFVCAKHRHPLLHKQIRDLSVHVSPSVHFLRSVLVDKVNALQKNVCSSK